MSRRLHVVLLCGGLWAVACSSDKPTPEGLGGSLTHEDSGDESLASDDEALSSEDEPVYDDHADEPWEHGSSRLDASCAPSARDASTAALRCTLPRLFIDKCTSVRDILLRANETCAGGSVGTLDYIETHDCAFGAKEAVLSCCYGPNPL
ncbi:MAG TPA: hypothetical protein VFX59_24120 [Polyangiales bacterium]|nr:hypothetical protein [Polyangiales bacterium]